MDTRSMLACSRLRCCSSQLLEMVGKMLCGCVEDDT